MMMTAYLATVNRVLARFGIANAIALNDFPKAERLVVDYVALSLADLAVELGHFGLMFDFFLLALPKNVGPRGPLYFSNLQ